MTDIMTNMKRVLAAALVLLATTAASIAQGAYPNRTVRLLCWTSAGSPLDVMMRQLGKQLGAMLGQTFVVDNRAGASGVVAMTALMGQPADGYTILSTTSSMSFTMASSTRLPYAASDFTVLPALQAEPSAVAVRADSRFKTLRELIDAMRANPDKLSVGGSRPAASVSSCSIACSRREIQVGLDSLQGRPGGRHRASGRPYRRRRDHAELGAREFQNGDIRLLGISSDGRDPYFPDVPTFKEQGLNVVERIWRSVMLKAARLGR